MTNAFVWQCPICEFEAHTSSEKKEHQDHMADAAHQKIVGMKGGEAMHEVGDQVKDAWEDIKDKAIAAKNSLKDKVM